MNHLPKGRDEDDDDEKHLEELSVPQIEVRDVQMFFYQDFEFIQKLQEPKRSFILRTYNKLMTTNQDMPYI